MDLVITPSFDSGLLGIGTSVFPMLGNNPYSHEMAEFCQGIGVRFAKKFTPSNQKEEDWLEKWIDSPHPVFQISPRAMIYDHRLAEVVRFVRQALS